MNLNNMMLHAVPNLSIHKGLLIDFDFTTHLLACQGVVSTQNTRPKGMAVSHAAIMLSIGCSLILATGYISIPVTYLDRKS